VSGGVLQKGRYGLARQVLEDVLDRAVCELPNGPELSRSAEAANASLQCRPSLLPNQDAIGDSPPSRLERVVRRQLERPPKPRIYGRHLTLLH
jgi:hypothetical protein